MDEYKYLSWLYLNNLDWQKLHKIKKLTEKQPWTFGTTNEGTWWLIYTDSSEKLVKGDALPTW